jgi:hypothetical protein
MNKKYYTGIGSRKTPLNILIMMAKISNILEKKGYTLRSGSAVGADSAFELGLESPHTSGDIYIPYLGFDKKMGKNNNKIKYIVPFFNKDLYFEANTMIMKDDLHKKWQYMKQDYVWKLHNRNVFQILGNDLKTPAKFVICYTSDGAIDYDSTDTGSTGGTGTAINLASKKNISVFNLKLKEHEDRLNKFIKDNEHLINYKYINNIVLISDFNKKNLRVSELLKKNESKNIARPKF